MDLHIPSCFSAFHCLAGNCPHTCCADWEVPIDSDTAAEYATLPGPLGVQLRRALRQDEERGCYASPSRDDSVLF